MSCAHEAESRITALETQASNLRAQVIELRAELAELSDVLSSVRAAVQALYPRATQGDFFAFGTSARTGEGSDNAT